MTPRRHARLYQPIVPSVFAPGQLTPRQIGIQTIEFPRNRVRNGHELGLTRTRLERGG